MQRKKRLRKQKERELEQGAQGSSSWNRPSSSKEDEEDVSPSGTAPITDEKEEMSDFTVESGTAGWFIILLVRDQSSVSSLVSFLCKNVFILN